MSKFQLVETDDISINEELEIRRSPETLQSEVEILPSCGDACVTFEGERMPEELEQQVAEVVDKRRRGFVATIWWQKEAGRAVISHAPVGW